MEEEQLTPSQQIRVYVGGLGDSVTSNDLRKIFSSMGVGSVHGVEIVRTKGRSFAYIDFFPSSNKSLTKLFSTYNGCVWKGGRLRVEKAKEHYLSRMRREWTEDADLASVSPCTCADVDEKVSSSEKPKESPISEKKQLKFFFPTLGKVKSLPFTGTGKHKYSFQRVEAPPLPTYFCDCQVHSSPLNTTEVKHAHGLGSQGVGMDEEELNVMKSVMNRLFQRENVTETVHSCNGHNTIRAIEDPQLDENEVFLESDEDNLVINVVSRGNNRLPMSASQVQETVLTKQKAMLNEKQTFGNGQMRDVVKAQKRNNVLSSKKRKLVILEERGRDESMPAELEGKGCSQAQLNESGPKTVFSAQQIEPDSCIKRSSFSWSQKSSWKALIGGVNSVFSVASFLPDSASNKEKKPRSDVPDVSDPTSSENQNFAGNYLEGQSGKTDIAAEHAEKQSAKLDVALNKSSGSTKDLTKERQRDGAPPKKRRKLLTCEEKEDLTPAHQESKGTPKMPANVLGTSMSLGATEPDLGHKRSASDSWCQKPLSKVLDQDGSNGINNVSNILTSFDSTTQESDIPSLHKSIDSEIQNLAGSNNGVCQSGEREVMLEGFAEAQPIKPDGASNPSGRGSSWLQKSSWTQLVNQNNSSFSIAQILPGITFGKQEITGANRVDVSNSSDSKHVDVVKQVTSKSSGSCSPKLADAPDKRQLTVASEDEASAPVVNKERDSALKMTLREDARIGETCSFMRNAASLKEWANAKKALTGPRKRKSNEK